LSRNVQELEGEIGVDLLRRGPRGVSLTAEGKLFLEEARELLKRADESVERVRALARGERASGSRPASMPAHRFQGGGDSQDTAYKVSQLGAEPGCVERILADHRDSPGDNSSLNRRAAHRRLD